MSGQRGADLDIARRLIGAGVPVFAAPPARRDGEWDPSGGHNGCGYLLPSGWQQTVATLSWLDPTQKGWERKAWRPGWALCALMGVKCDGLDVDPRHDGDRTRAELLAGGVWPVVYGVAHTPSGGTHELVAPLGAGSRDGLRPGLDVKGGRPDGQGRGFLFIAPTVKLSKATGSIEPYTWERPPDLDALLEGDDSGEQLAEMVRAALAAKVDSPAGATMSDFLRAPIERSGPVAAGSRRDVAYRYACSLEARGVEPHEAAILMRARVAEFAQVDEKGRPSPFTVDEGLVELRNAYRKHRTAERTASLAAKDQQQAGDGTPALMTAQEAEQHVRRLSVVRASQIAVRPVHWLWQDRLPLGSLALLAGREGIGKSTVAYQLAADLTRGRLPGRHQGACKSVVVAATEDSWEHTIVPRLMAADADLERVLRVDVTTSEGVRSSLTLPRDTEQLGELVTAEDVALVLLDPLMSRLDSKLDSHKDAEVRVALEPITDIADRTGAAVLGIIHVNKGRGADALDRIMGSKAFPAVARSVLFVLKDPDVEGRRLLGTPKNNLGRTDNLATLAFEITSSKVADTDDGPIWTGKVVWKGEVAQSIDDALSDSEDPGDVRTATGEAADWLVDWLTQQGGEAFRKDVMAAGQKAGHNVEALKRARKRAKVSTRSHGFPRQSVWSLTELVGSTPVGSSLGESAPIDLTNPTDPTGSPVRSVSAVGSVGTSPTRATPLDADVIPGAGHALTDDEHEALWKGAAL